MGWNFFKDVLGGPDPFASGSDPNNPNNWGGDPTADDKSAGSGATGHWNPDGSWTWDNGPSSGQTVTAPQAQANKDLFDQHVSDPAAAQKAKDAWVQNNYGDHAGVEGDKPWGHDPFGAVPKQINADAPGASLDTTQSDASRSSNQGLIDMLQQQATTGDGAWQQSFTDALTKAKGNASALGQARANSGGNYAESLRDIGNAQSSVAQRGIGEEQGLRAESKNNAQDELSQLLAGQGAGDIQQAADAAAVQQQRRTANQALVEQGRNTALSTLSSIGSALSKGGRVPGTPLVFGDDSRNDVVPAMLSPQEIVVPISAAKDPDKAADFARAVAKRGKIKRLADGGSADDGTGVGSAPGPSDGQTWKSIFLPHIGIADYYNSLEHPEAPSIDNGGLLDTSGYAQTRGQMSTLGGQLGARAAGGNSVADSIAQTQSDDALSRAMMAGNQRASLADVLASTAAAGAKTAGEAGNRRQAEQAGGQKQLGALLDLRRRQEQALAGAQQKAGWNNTMTNANISLANQALLRNQLAAAGQGFGTLASLHGGGGDSAGGGGDEVGDPSSAADNDFDLNAGSFGDEAGGGGDTEGDTRSAADNDGGGGDGMAHGGRISFARAARMSKGGEAKPVAHLTILIPAPMPAMSVGDGRSFAQAARRMADGGNVHEARADFERQKQKNDYPIYGEQTGDTTITMSEPAVSSRPLRRKDAPSADENTVTSSDRQRADYDYKKNHQPHLQLPMLAQRAHGGSIPGYADGGAADPGPLEKLANAVQAGARLSRGYAEGGAVRGYSGEAGYPDAQVVAPDAGTSVPVPPAGNFTPAPAADAGTPAIPQASFQPVGTMGLDRRGPNGEAIPWEKSLEHQATTPPPAKLPPMRPPAVAAPAVAKAPPPASHLAATDALRAPYAKAEPDAFGAEMQARRQEGELKAQQATDLAKAQGAYQQQLQANALEQSDLMKRAHADASAVMGRYNDAVEQMKHIDTTIDPGRFWATRSVPQQIAGIIGLALGSFSPDGVNRSAQLLGKAIDRDVDVQKAEVEARLKKGEGAVSALQTAYAMNRQLFQNDLAANAATKASLLDLSINQAEQIKTAYSGKLAGPEADTFIAQLKTARDKYNAQAHSQVVEDKLKGAETAKAYAEAGKAGSTSGPSLVSPGYASTGAIKLGPEELSKFREGVANQSTLAKQADELSGLITNSSQLQVGDSASRAKAIAAQMKSNLKEMEKLGALSSSDYALLDDQLPDPSAIFTLDSTKKAKLNQFTRELENRVAAHAGSLGLVRTGSRPMTQSQLEE